MSLLSKYESNDDLAINGEKEITKFLKENYSKFTMYQLCKVLGITPGVIQDTLTDTQLPKVGRRAVASVMIIRDMSHFEKDYNEDKGA